MRVLAVFVLALFINTLLAPVAMAAKLIPCLDKVKRGGVMTKNGRFAINNRDERCVQYRKSEEVVTQKRLTRLQDYVKNKEPLWQRERAAYIKLKAESDANRKNWVESKALYKDLLKTRKEQVTHWQKQFVTLKKHKSPPPKQFWENPWFWTTTLIVAVGGVALTVYAINSSSNKGTTSSSMVMGRSIPALYVKRNLVRFNRPTRVLYQPNLVLLQMR